MKITIRVECYSGYKAEEGPCVIYWDNIRYEVSEILDRWYQGDLNPEWTVSNYYKILTATDEIFIIKHEIVPDEWYLIEIHSIKSE